MQIGVSETICFEIESSNKYLIVSQAFPKLSLCSLLSNFQYLSIWIPDSLKTKKWAGFISSIFLNGVSPGECAGPDA